MRAFGGLLLWLVSPALLAQMLPGEIDKRDGEEYQIQQRERWFSERRGLAFTPQAAQLRAASAAELALRSGPPLRGAGALWTPLGPATMSMFTWAMGRVTGRVQALAVHPSDENTLYLGTAAGGLWKTTDGGQNWNELFGQIGTQTIGSVHIEAANPSRVWVGTGEDKSSCSGYFGIGLYLSVDAGGSFVARNGSGSNTLNLSWISAVASKPGSPNTVFAGGTGVCDASGNSSAGGLYRSLDGGSNWTRILSGALYDIVFDPSNANTVYAGFGGTTGVWKSTDGGANFVKLSNGITYGSGRLRIALAPSNPQVLYSIQGNSLHRSTDGGSSFALRNGAACEGQCTYNMTLDVHPSNPDELIVGTIRHARSTDGGVTLTAMTSTWGGGQAVHQDTHVVRYSRSNGNRFWVGTDGGLWRSDNGGSSYANLNANIDSVLFYDVAVDPRDPTRVFGGAQDNSSSGRFAGGLIWDTTRVTGDGMMNLVVPENPSIVVQAGYPSSGFPSVHRSLTGGAPNTLSTIPTTGLVNGGFPWVTPLAASPAHHVHPGTLFIGSNRIWRGIAATPNASWTWTEVTTAALASTINVIEAYIGGDGALGVYAGGSNGRVYRCANVHSSAGCVDVTGSLPTGRTLTDIAVDRRNPQRIFVTRADFQGARLYRSLDQGNTWSAIGNGLPQVPANSVTIAPRDAQQIFVATDIGIYTSVDGGANFAPYNDGMPIGNVVMDLEVLPARDAIVAGSYGRGAWLLNLSDTLLVDGNE